MIKNIKETMYNIRYAISQIWWILVMVAVVICAIAYQVWQFSLCYPEVSDSFWYCFQHAG